MSEGYCCKICIITKGKGALDERFSTAEEMYRHLETDHGIPMPKEGETPDECLRRFKMENKAAADDTLNHDRVEWLIEVMFEKLKENIDAGPVSRFRIWEGLNALATCAATLLGGSQDPRAHAFFIDCLDKMRHQVDIIHRAEEINVESKTPVP